MFLHYRDSKREFLYDQSTETLAWLDHRNVVIERNVPLPPESKIVTDVDLTAYQMYCILEDWRSGEVFGNIERRKNFLHSSCLVHSISHKRDNDKNIHIVYTVYLGQNRTQVLPEELSFISFGDKYEKICVKFSVGDTVLAKRDDSAYSLIKNTEFIVEEVGDKVFDGTIDLLYLRNVVTGERLFAPSKFFKFAKKNGI